MEFQEDEEEEELGEEEGEILKHYQSVLMEVKTLQLFLSRMKGLTSNQSRHANMLEIGRC